MSGPIESNLVQDCAIHPSGKLVVAGFVDGSVRFLDCSGAELIEDKKLEVHQDSCRGVAYTQQDATLLTCSADRSLMLYDLQSSKIEAQLQEAHECAIERCCLGFATPT